MVCMHSHGIAYVHDEATLDEDCMHDDTLIFSWFNFMTESLKKITMYSDYEFLYVNQSVFCSIFYHIAFLGCEDLELGLMMDYEYTIKFLTNLIAHIISFKCLVFRF